MPTHLTDLSSFNVTKFADGSKNLLIVSEIPSGAYGTEKTASSSASAGPTRTAGPEVLIRPVNAKFSAHRRPSTANSAALLQLSYPAHSSDPSLSPVGGADFYASPLPLLNATSVSLGYSVFFPADFDFVKGGKLPGLYGGHTRCSGGASAEACWSTRLMWRKGGMGELYLYAPLAAQTPSLCSTPPQTICGSADGQSIGRGAFNFTRGTWTHVRQTVTLNTPGCWDGAFSLEVDGERVIDLEGVYFRHAVESGDDDGGDDDADGDGNDGDDDGGLLGPLTGGILLEMDDPDVLGYQAFLMRPAATSSHTNTSSLSKRAPRNLRGRAAIQPVGFLGLFFSTFFGGSGDSWATKRETWAWFKDFSMIINN